MGHCAGVLAAARAIAQGIGACVANATASASITDIPRIDPTT